MTSFENMKRYWKRKEYQRLGDTTNRKPKIKTARLGSQRQQVVKVNETPKVMLKFISPIKFFSKVQNGLVVCSSSNNDKKLLQIKPDGSTKGRAMPMAFGTNNEVVDARMVLEIYKRLVSSGEVARLLV